MLASQAAYAIAYVRTVMEEAMDISLTELRQRLFQLADHVADTGEAVSIVRNGVRLRLCRDEPATAGEGRLARLVQQSAVVGAPLQPDESPAAWTGAMSRVAEPGAPWPRVARKRAPRAK